MISHLSLPEFHYAVSQIYKITPTFHSLKIASHELYDSKNGAHQPRSQISSYPVLLGIPNPRSIRRNSIQRHKHPQDRNPKKTKQIAGNKNGNPSFGSHLDEPEGGCGGGDAPGGGGGDVGRLGAEARLEEGEEARARRGGRHGRDLDVVAEVKLELARDWGR